MYKGMRACTGGGVARAVVYTWWWFGIAYACCVSGVNACHAEKE